MIGPIHDQAKITEVMSHVIAAQIGEVTGVTTMKVEVTRGVVVEVTGETEGGPEVTAGVTVGAAEVTGVAAVAILNLT